jgi:hypothetical protein
VSFCCHIGVDCRLEMVTPTEYVGNLMELANNRRGEFVEMKYLTGQQEVHSGTCISSASRHTVRVACGMLYMTCMC